MKPYYEIESIKELKEVMSEMGSDHVFRHIAFQDIDLMAVNLEGYSFADCIFMSCNMTRDIENRMDSRCTIFPGIELPFRMFQNRLYDASSLYGNWEDSEKWSFEKCYDTEVYRHYKEEGNPAPDIKEAFGRSTHDFSMNDALADFLSGYDPKSVVAIMGGHSISRADESYSKVAKISKKLTEEGKLMASGGGPGAMEAAHLGAYMAGRTKEEVDEAIEILSLAPTFQDAGWLAQAFKVMERFPLASEYKSLSIPTWYYGHEPPSAFATHIAKLFENSVREDTLLTEAYGGLIFMEGSAGTLQEIFQEAVQNHYVSLGYPSPMIFVGKHFWTEEVPDRLVSCVVEVARRDVHTRHFVSLHIGLARGPLVALVVEDSASGEE